MQRAHKVLDRLCWLAAVWTGLSLGAPLLRAEPPVTKETVIRAWKERQDRVKSARIEWTDRETVPQGFLSNYFTAAGFGAKDLEEIGIRPGTAVPPRDVTHDVISAVCLDGDKVRLERDDRQWSGVENAFVISPFVSVFDGKAGKTLLANGGVGGKPQASLEPGYTSYMDGPYMTPVALAYRPFIHRVSPTDPDALAATGRKGVVNGIACLELERTFPGSGLTQRVWVDPSLHYVPVRLIFQRQDRITSKLDITYRRGADGECVLEKWEGMRFDRGGKLERANRVRVTRCEINTAVPPEAFDVAFPAGTVVVDKTNPRAGQQYIATEWGRMSSSLSWPVILTTAAGLLAGAWFVRRRMILRKRLS